jgi:hypothetical protein
MPIEFIKGTYGKKFDRRQKIWDSLYIEVMILWVTITLLKIVRIDITL